MLKTPIRKKMKTWCGVSETDTKMKLLRQKKILSRHDFFQLGMNKPLRKVNVLILEAIVSNFNGFWGIL